MYNSTRSKGLDSRARIALAEQNLRNKLEEGRTCSRLGLRSSGTPSCLDFGVERRTKYPGRFFCSQCDWFEEEYMINTKIKLGSAKYKCVAGHDNWVHPSSMIENMIINNTVPKQRNKTNENGACKTRIIKDIRSVDSDNSIISGTTTLCNTENDVNDTTDDDYSNNSTNNMKQNKSNKRRTTSTIRNDSTLRHATTNQTRTTTIYDLEKEANKLFDDDSNDSISTFERKTNNKRKKGNKSMHRKKRKVPASYTNDSNTSHNVQTYYNIESDDDYEISLEDFEGLKQDLERKFLELKLETETMQEINLEIKQDHAVKQVKLTKERSYYKKLSEIYKNKHNLLENDSTLPSSFSDLPIYVDDFMSTIKQFSAKKNRNAEKLAETLVDMIWDDDFLDGFFVECLIRRSKFWLRTNVFSPERILETMDNNGGHLSMTAVEILRTLETNGEKKSTDTILPSSFLIKKACKEVDKYCEKVLPFELGTMQEGGEYARFKAEHVLPLMYKAYGMEEEATIRPIKTNVAMDSAKISNRIHHTTVGLKMADRMARDPKTGKLLVGMIDESSTLQSKHHCFPLKVGLQKENNSTYSQFSDVFDELKELEIEGIPKLYGFKPPKTSLNADMSATWKILGVGHAAKNCKYPCHLCAIHDDNLIIPNGIQCNRWCRQLHSDDPSVKCYHKDLLSEENVEKLRETIKDLNEGIETMIPELDNLKKKSKIDVDEDPRGIIVHSSLRNPRSIHFNLTHGYNKQDDVFQFSKNVTDCLKLHKLSCAGTLSDRKERLRTQLIEEWYLRKTIESLQHSEKMDTSQFLLLQCVPCILHLEIRVGIKILSIILGEGIKNAASFKILTDGVNIKSRGASNKNAKAYILEMQNILTQEIWGTKDKPASWKMPYYNEDGQYLEAISLCNQSTRQVLRKISLIIDKSICDEDRKEKYKACIKNYTNAMNILRKKEDLTNNEIFEFQNEVDKFSNIWIGLNQRAGITNYIHLLASGHIADFLMHHRNLYEHSQQGWEALNSMLKVFFFRRTTRGGGRGDGSKVRQIARWLARRMIWLTKIEYSTIIDYNNNEEKQQESMIEDDENDIADDTFFHDGNDDILEPLHMVEYNEI